jgi:hypothetical protein
VNKETLQLIPQKYRASRDYCDNHAPRNWKNLEEMDKFWDIYKSNYEDIRKPKTIIVTNKTESVIKSVSQQRKVQD